MRKPPWKSLGLLTMRCCYFEERLALLGGVPLPRCICSRETLRSFRPQDSGTRRGDDAIADSGEPPADARDTAGK
jgi:hypothetical protein